MFETATVIAKRLGISRAALYDRFKQGWKYEAATTRTRQKSGRKRGGRNKPKSQSRKGVWGSCENMSYRHS
jgi:hypothetical protein